jgi:prepilin-type N-terminal cleavage/methylation domain-containing protein
MKFWNTYPRGFTIIEIIVVIAVIAALSSFVLINIQSARAKAGDIERVAYIKEVLTILRVYKDQNNEYPLQTPTDLGSELMSQLSPKYIESIPEDAFWYFPIPMIADCAGNPGTCNKGAQIPKTQAVLATDIYGDYSWCDHNAGPCLCYLGTNGYKDAIPDNQDLGVAGVTQGYPWQDDGIPWWIEAEASGGFVECSQI